MANSYWHACVASVIALGISQGSPTQTIARDTVKSLVKFSADRHLALFVELDAQSFVNPRATPSLELDCRILASQLHRSYKQVAGAQAFSRRASGGISPTYVRGLWAELLSNLGPAAIQKAARGELTTDELAAAERSQLLSLAAAFPQLAGAVCAGRPLKLSVHVEAGMRYTDPRTGEQAHFTIPHPLPTEETPLTQSSKPGNKMDVDQAPPDGELDMKKGEVLGLAELLSRASKAFKTPFAWDGRLSNTFFFVSGRYTLDRFRDCLREVADVPPIDVGASSSLAEAKMLDDLLKGPLSKLLDTKGFPVGLDQQIFSGGTIKAQDAWMVTEYTASYFNKHPLPEGTSIELYPAIVVTLDAGGRTGSDANAVDIILHR